MLLQEDELLDVKRCMYDTGFNNFEVAGTNKDSAGVFVCPLQGTALQEKYKEGQRLTTRTMRNLENRM